MVLCCIKQGKNITKLSENKNKEIKIAIIGLGYVGLPLAVEFGRKYDTDYPVFWWNTERAGRSVSSLP